MPSLKKNIPGEHVEVRGAPNLKGLTFRRPPENPDFRDLAQVIQVSRDADRYELVETPEDIRDDFRHLQNCDPRKDMLCVEVDGTLVGFCRCEWRVKADGTRIYQHVVHLVPEWRRRGLRSVLVQENERRIRDVARRHSEKHPKFIEVSSSYFPNPWKRLLEREGYTRGRHTLVLVRPNFRNLPKVSLPDGFEVRPYTKDHLRAIFYATAEAFRDEPNFMEEFWTDEGMEYFQEWRAFNPKLWQVAWAGREVAGAVINMIDAEENRKFDRKWGYLMMIFVRRPYRNKGLASALIARSLEVLRRAGMSQAALGVDSENPSGARRLYERMGFLERDHYVRFRKPLK